MNLSRRWSLSIVLGLGLLAGCATQPVAMEEITEDMGTEEVATTPAEPAAEPAAAPGAETAAAETPAAPAPASVYVEDGVAISGADAVAYFTEGQYVPGSAEYVYNWGNATWQFASPENRDLFASAPQQYAPQYGGYCAWAVSQGYTAPTDPNAWKIVDGKLYLNYSQGVQRRWERDIPGHIAQADSNWPAVAN